MNGRSRIVLHADDFGMNAAVNAGILHAFREGLLTSTSLLANAPAADQACAAWPRLLQDLRAGSLPSTQRRRRLEDDLEPFDIGIHLNLSQGRPLSTDYPAELLDAQGNFPGIGRVFRHLRAAGSRWSDPVRNELRLQIERMVDCGIRPTHLNGHQYVELIPGIAALVPELMARYSIQTVRVARERHLWRVLAEGRVAAFAVALVKRFYAGRFQSVAAGLKAPDQFFGTAHAGLVTRTTLQRFLNACRGSRCTEIGLHPALRTEERPPADAWFDPLAATRPGELEWLCDPATTDLIAAYGLGLGRLTRRAES